MNRIPNRRNRPESNQHHTCVVHAGRSHGQRRWHAEQHHLESDPYQSYHVDDRSDDAAKIPPRFEDLLTLVEQADSDWDGIRQSQGLYTDRSESSEGAAAAEIDQS